MAALMDLDKDDVCVAVTPRVAESLPLSLSRGKQLRYIGAVRARARNQFPRALSRRVWRLCARPRRKLSSFISARRPLILVYESRVYWLWVSCGGIYTSAVYVSAVRRPRLDASATIYGMGKLVRAKVRAGVWGKICGVKF